VTVICQRHLHASRIADNVIITENLLYNIRYYADVHTGPIDDSVVPTVDESMETMYAQLFDEAENDTSLPVYSLSAEQSYSSFGLEGLENYRGTGPREE
jgi:hypothetical protein